MWYTLLRDGMCPFIGGQNEFVDGLSCSCSAYGKVAVSPISYALRGNIYVTPVAIPFWHQCKAPPGFDYYRSLGWFRSSYIKFKLYSGEVIEIKRSFPVDSRGPTLVNSLTLEGEQSIPCYSSAYQKGRLITFDDGSSVRYLDYIPTVELYSNGSETSYLTDI